MLGENLEALRGPLTWAKRSKDEIALHADKWDRFGIRWFATRAVWHDGRGDMEWMSNKPIGGGATRPAVMTGTELEARGPFTSESPLAEDQEPVPSFYDFVDKENTGESKDVRDPEDGMTDEEAGDALMEALASDHAPEYDEALPLPPDKWDRLGVRWSAFWESGKMYWRADTQAGRLVLAHKDPALERRGPFTETSPLAEDQEPDPDAGKDTDAQPGGETKEPGMWSEPWVPDFDGSEPEDRLMFFATMSALWDATSSPKDEDRLRWIGGGLIAWIGRKYHVYDQPDENGVDWRMRATAAETELAIAREQEPEDEGLPKSERARYRRRRAEKTTSRRSVPLSRLRGDIHRDVFGATRFIGPHMACGCVVADDKQSILLCDAHDHWQETGMRLPDEDVDPEIERDAISELRTGTDPTKWAGEFVRLFEGEVVSWRTTPLTPTLMQAWFSAAIQAGHEAGVKVGREAGLEEWKTHAANLERALGELRADFISINNIAGQHAAYEGNKEKS